MDFKDSKANMGGRNFWKVLDVYNPYLQYEIQMRRFYEVFEVQSICEEFINFLT